MKRGKVGKTLRWVEEKKCDPDRLGVKSRGVLTKESNQEATAGARK